jgi:hypothetical protein
VLLGSLLLAWLTRTSLRDTALRDSVLVLHGRTEVQDSWWPMGLALLSHRLHPGQLLYATLFFGERIKFQYPPSSLLVCYPAVQAPVASALGRLGLEWVDVLNGIGQLLVFATAIVVADLLRRGVPGLQRKDAVVLVIAGVVLTLTYYPIVRAYTLGQIQAWLNAFFAAVAWCWVRGRKGAAGVFAGLMCLVKPQYGVLLVWGLLRRQGQFVAATALTGVLGLVVSVMLFGVANHLDYLGVLSYIGRHGESYFRNQSVNGLVNRLLGNGANLDWNYQAFAPYHPVVHAATWVSSLLLLGLALLWPVCGPARGSALDLGVAALACTLASPVAWDHHYGVFLPVYALLFLALPQGSRGKAARLLLAVSFFLTGNYIAAVNRLAGTPWNFLQSYMLAGGFLVLALAWRWRSIAAEARTADLPSPLRLWPGPVTLPAEERSVAA